MEQRKILALSEIIDCEFSDKVADHLIQTGCYNIDLSKAQDEWYHWKSGIIAPCYCNCRDLLSTVKERRDIVNYLSSSIRKNFPTVDCIAGMETAGIPWASMVALTLNLPVIYIRKVAKEHGIGKRIEGNSVSLQNVVLIDDLIASGESLLGAIYVIHSETRLNVLGIQSIINWRFEKMFELLGNYQIHALTSYEQIILSAHKFGLIQSHEVEYMLDFYRAPFTYDWKGFYDAKGDF